MPTAIVNAYLPGRDLRLGEISAGYNRIRSNEAGVYEHLESKSFFVNIILYENTDCNLDPMI